MATSHATADAHEHAHGAEHHGPTVGTYNVVIIALLVLLIITLGAAAVDLGSLNLPIAMVIAVIKAAIVMTFFMHLKFSSGVVRTFAVMALVFLVLLWLFPMADFMSRGMMPY